MQMGKIVLMVVFAMVLMVGTMPVQAGIVASGDVDPADPTTWTSSTYAYIGKIGIGTLSISNDSDVLSKYGFIGAESGSMGQVTVDGVGSKWTNNGLYVGRYGSGTLNIMSGGAVLSGGGYIGYYSNSTGQVTVEGVGSTWTNNGYLLDVGGYGNGTLDITNGGTLLTSGTGPSNLCIIGWFDGSIGVVTVTGANSMWTNNSRLYVGNSGDGTLNINEGGEVRIILSESFLLYVSGVIQMKTGGKLSLSGGNYTENIDTFLEAFGASGSDIKYYDGTWKDIDEGERNTDYTLTYSSPYTTLTVGVPTP